MGIWPTLLLARVLQVSRHGRVPSWRCGCLTGRQQRSAYFALGVRDDVPALVFGDGFSAGFPS